MNYQVLARKYRPLNFAQLKGQDVLVATLNHAILSDKIAHAILLSGIQGIGKTTTARIIAKTINCTNPQDGVACEQCPNCVSLKEENHPDIIEIDAASKTGIDDVREIIESMHYSPILAKYKVYIIDEVHMLSNNAFNALLKTLEEPPAHVKFIFATTVSKKIPLTILSRCQIFELKRFTVNELCLHLEEICDKENIAYERDAIKIIAQHGDGSVRDSLSLLDRVILGMNDRGLQEIQGQARDDINSNAITTELVEKLLGISDKAYIYQLFQDILRGEVEKAITLANEIYYKGTDPLRIIEDLMTICNLVSKSLSIKDYLKHNDYLTDSECELIAAIAAKVNIRSLAIIWQMLLKGFEEISVATNDIAALEMIIIRICCLADLPTPEQIIKGEKITHTTDTEMLSGIEKFAEIVNLFAKNREIILCQHLKNEVELIDIQDNSVTIKLDKDLPKDFINQITIKLKEWTDVNWQFIIADKNCSGQSIAAYEQEKRAKKRMEIESSSIVENVMKAFPGSIIENIK